jgi:hypothetical protein
MSREFGKPERGKVSIRQSDVQRWRVRKVPWSIGAARRFRGVLHSDAALAELSISCGSSLPLFPDHRPKSASVLGTQQENGPKFLLRAVLATRYFNSRN